ncbi:uncharacterized protein LOC142977909 [Anticarsia gemmatalis]|uniref:uncharacterized protein LOC142977909 n=1 Tax=Anticarsia gemmatalis TaxID=129554 RepID=UPI003F766487
MENANNTFNSMSPLIWILKVFCINCNVKENSKRTFTVVRSFFTVLLLGCINFTGLYYKITRIYLTMDLSIKLTDSVQIVFDFCQYVVDVNFVLNLGRHTCVQYFKQYEYIDNALNVTCYAMIKTKLVKLIIFFFIIWFISSTLDLTAWVITYGWVTPLCHSITYLFMFIKMLTTLDLIAHVIHIEVRLRIIGDLMQSCYSSLDNAPYCIAIDCINHKSWLNSNKGTKTHVLKSNFTDSKEIKSLASCYLLLTEQVSFMNKTYGVRILLTSLSLLFDMIKITNLAVRIILGSQRTVYGSGYFPTVSSLFRVITCATIFVTTANQCESAYRQRERIVNIMDHLLINKNPDDDLRTAVSTFRDLIQNRTIDFNMANFFSLNYSLLLSLTSVVVSYTIILLQSVN